MAKLSKKALSELDLAIDHLGGGVLPLQPPKPVRRRPKARKTVKTRPRKAAKAGPRKKK